jgi:drug/metabolite transporter (DMT)-like permease
LAFAIANVLQQSTARSTALVQAPPSRWRRWLPVLGFLGRIMRQPQWLLGWVFAAAGFCAQALALHLGALGVVEAVIASQLLFALLIKAVRHSLRPSRWDWLAATCVCGGVALLVLLRGGVHQKAPDRLSLAVFLGVVVLVIGAMVGIARRVRHHVQTRTAIVAVGSGLAAGATAAVAVLVTADLSHGFVHGLGWPLGAMLGLSAISMVLAQDAFASGSLPTALTAQTIADPVISMVAGVIFFDSAPLTGAALWLGVPLSIVLIGAGVTLLANSPIMHDERTLTAPQPVTVPAV